MTGLAEAQDGAALYQQRCSSCHESPEGRTPSIGALKQMTGEAIYAALTNGAMKSQTSGLSTKEVISLLVYIAPAGRADTKPAFEKSCTGNAARFTADNQAGASAWGGWSPSVTNPRYQDAKAAGLAAADVPRLKLKWAFNLGPVTMARRLVLWRLLLTLSSWMNRGEFWRLNSGGHCDWHAHDANC